MKKKKKEKLKFVAKETAAVVKLNFFMFLYAF